MQTLLKKTLFSIIVLIMTISNAQAKADDVVVLLHGIANIPLSMTYLERSLVRAGYSVLNLGYPSTQVSVDEAASRVRKSVMELGEDTRVHFVAHSLGNIVVRKMLTHELPNLGRVVMIAPPNRGSIVAGQLKELKLYRWIYGPAGQQLSSENDHFFDNLVVPPGEFGIIAGGKGDGKGYNPLLPGDDDGTVRVKETKLAGARDFILIRNTHTLILFDKETVKQTIHFLKYGSFVTKD